MTLKEIYNYVVAQLTGSLASLNTTDKSNLVAAINEVKSSLALDVVEIVKTASFTVAEADKHSLYVVNSSSAVTITLPTGLTAGIWWEVLNIGTGTVAFAAGSGAAIISADNRKTIRTTYGYARVICRTSNFSLGGDLIL